MARPVPLGPKTSVVFPSALVLMFFVFFHVPTNSLAVWAVAMQGAAMARANTVEAIDEVFIVELPCARDRASGSLLLVRASCLGRSRPRRGPREPHQADHQQEE